MKSIFITLVAITISLTSIAQVNEGKVSYTIDMSSDDPNMQAQFAMLQGSKMDMLFTEEFSRVEFNMGMIIQMTTITNNDKNTGLMLMSGMVGNKAVKMTTEDIEKSTEEAPNFEVEATNETKEILGYNCNKYILTTEEGSDVIYWTTKDIVAAKTNNRYMIKSVEGFPLMFESESNGVKMTFTANEFKDSLKGMKTKDLFEMTVPEGYQEMTMEELKGMGM